MKNILFISPPAGGKGTMSSKLAQDYGYIHISTGDLLRNIDKTSELGIKVNKLISRGEFVSDEIVSELLKEKIATLKENEHFILDGFPRNLHQAKMLDEILKSIGHTLDLVIELNVPYDICLKRALGRLTCSNCKTIYNKFFNPTKIDGLCDKCNSTLNIRADDTEETYKDRYNTYMEITNPLVDYYEKENKIVKIDGVNNTYETLVSVINND